tara:strand:- start:177 stop:611 length:435 start_codon:yes stop_codon:yes gene_type:complete
VKLTGLIGTNDKLFIHKLPRSALKNGLQTNNTIMTIMTNELTIEQRFALQRARYETARMTRPALEKTVVRLLRSRMEQKNGIQDMLMTNGILFKVEEHQSGLPEIISEETFIDMLEMQDDNLPTSIDDVGYEDDDIDNDGLALM